MTDLGDELVAIRRMMDEAQRAIEDNGKYFVTWGVLTIVGLVATYATVTGDAPIRTLWIAWAALVALGWLLGARWGRRDDGPARTIASTMVADGWSAVGIALSVLVFAGAVSGTLPPQAVPGVASALLGSGAFASASAYRQLPLRAMALVWWVGAIVMLLWPGAYTILLMTAMVLVLFVAPGLLLWARVRANRARVDAA